MHNLWKTVINLNYRESLFYAFFAWMHLNTLHHFPVHAPSPHTQFNSLWLDAHEALLRVYKILKTGRQWTHCKMPHSLHFVHSDHLWCVFAFINSTNINEIHLRPLVLSQWKSSELQSAWKANVVSGLETRWNTLLISALPLAWPRVLYVQSLIQHLKSVYGRSLESLLNIHRLRININWTHWSYKYMYIIYTIYEEAVIFDCPKPLPTLLFLMGMSCLIYTHFLSSTTRLPVYIKIRWHCRVRTLFH